jgi:uncharacterized membrane protein YdjX (TVP38/TMEM64 family)
MKRLFWLFFGLAVLLLIPFFIWGDVFEARLSGKAAVEWLRQYGSWAWAAGVLLLLGDLLLPVPGTAVMSALGFIYGPVLGGVLSATGSVLAGLLGYGICRWMGRTAALYILTPEDLHEGEQLFRQSGGWIVAVSRWLPLLPEVIACMAGLVRMPFLYFVIALACGSIPLGFTFAFIGHAGVEYPVVALLLSAGLPPILWYFAQASLRISPRAETAESSNEESLTD